MDNVALFVSNIPPEWASEQRLTDLFWGYDLGHVHQIYFSTESTAYVYFHYWSTSQWSANMRHQLLTTTDPAFVSISDAAAELPEFLVVHRLHTCREVAMWNAITSLEEQLAEMRRELGLQCESCENTQYLEEDDEEWGKHYCPACWFDWNNAEAIRAKEREIDVLQLKINELWAGIDPQRDYKVEDLLECIQEKRDEIAMLKSTDIYIDVP